MLGNSSVLCHKTKIPMEPKVYSRAFSRAQRAPWVTKFGYTCIWEFFHVTIHVRSPGHTTGCQCDFSFLFTLSWSLQLCDWRPWRSSWRSRLLERKNDNKAVSQFIRLSFNVLADVDNSGKARAYKKNKKQNKTKQRRRVSLETTTWKLYGRGEKMRNVNEQWG